MKVKYKTIDKEEIAKKGFMPYEYKAEKVEFCCAKSLTNLAALQQPIS